jgi:hypothetical protein
MLSVSVGLLVLFIVRAFAATTFSMPIIAIRGAQRDVVYLG